MELGSDRHTSYQMPKRFTQPYFMSRRKLPLVFGVLSQHHPVFGNDAAPAVAKLSCTPFYGISTLRWFSSSTAPPPSEPTGLPPTGLPPGFIVQAPAINPPDAVNPDPATLREQWQYAIRLFSRWYSHAWGMTVLSGLTFFALGWALKGENPLRTTLAEKRREIERKRIENLKDVHN